MATHKTIRRSRFLWFVLPTMLLVALVGFALWFQFRPLNAVEQKLVGTWRNQTVGMTFTLTHNREFYKAGRRYGGLWYVLGNELYTPETFSKETWRTVGHALQTGRIRQDSPCVITFDDDNHVTVFVPINGDTFHWERLKRPPD